MEFLGEFEHSLDDKGRVVLPAEFRPPLEGGAVISSGVSGCLAVYTPTEWDRVSSEVREQSKEDEKRLMAARAFFAGAKRVVPDRQGRVAIPPNLRGYAGLERDVVITGAWSRIEIWARSRWSGAKGEGEGALAEASQLPGFGV
jgi:MraZ protein